MMKNRLLGILKCKCPKCEKGDVFSYKGNAFLIKAPIMKNKCDVCGHVFSKEVGFFWGAAYVSYGITVAEGILIFILSQFIFEETFDLRIILIIVPAILLLSPFNFRLSRMIWMYMFTKKE